MKALLTAVLLLTSAAPAALAQREIPKAEGHDQCPLSNVNTLGTTCVSPIYYEVAPTNDKACKEGWMNIGAGYCKKIVPLQPMMCAHICVRSRFA